VETRTTASELGKNDPKFTPGKVIYNRTTRMKKNIKEEGTITHEPATDSTNNNN